MSSWADPCGCFKGAELNPPLRGNQVTVVVEEVDGGNYSCHSADGQYLNHTVIFVQVTTENVILKEMPPEEGKIRKDECVICVCVCVCLRAALVLTAPLLLQAPSNAPRPTTPARFTVPGPERLPDPRLLCCYSRQHGDSFILLL